MRACCSLALQRAGPATAALASCPSVTKCSPGRVVLDGLHKCRTICLARPRASLSPPFAPMVPPPCPPWYPFTPMVPPCPHGTLLPPWYPHAPMVPPCPHGTSHVRPAWTSSNVRLSRGGGRHSGYHPQHTQAHHEALPPFPPCRYQSRNASLVIEHSSIKDPEPKACLQPPFRPAGTSRARPT